MQQQENSLKPTVKGRPINAISVLLIDDQEIVCEAIKGMLRDQSDIELQYCCKGAKALELAIEVQPTVILQDLIMPDADGLKLVTDFRTCKETKDIPLIVLSSKEDADIKATSFRLGANDYLVKLPNRVELIARIRYHSQAYTRLLERNDAFKKLEESQNTLNQELAEAAHYVRSLLPVGIEQGDTQARWVFLPSAQLGGDGFGYQWLDNNYFAFYLLDVCGHGVGAALLSISVIHMLRSLLQEGAEPPMPSKVLQELNVRFPMEKNNDLFFTIWFGLYDKQKKVVKYACGGHPPAIVVRTKSKTEVEVFELKGDGTAIGVKPQVEFNTESFSISEGDRLYLFSDGIFELQTPDDKTMTLEEFLPVFRKSKSDRNSMIESILSLCRDISGKSTFEDDVSLLEITFLR